MAAKNVHDEELKAIATAAELIHELDHDGQARVVDYLTARFPDKPAERVPLQAPAPGVVPDGQVADPAVLTP